MLQKYWRICIRAWWKVTEKCHCFCRSEVKLWRDNGHWSRVQTRRGCQLRHTLYSHRTQIALHVFPKTCMFMCEQELMPVCMWQSEDSLGCQSSGAIYLDRISHWHWTHLLAQSGWLVSSRDPPASTCPELGLKMHATMFAFFHIMCIELMLTLAR